MAEDNNTKPHLTQYGNAILTSDSGKYDIRMTNTLRAILKKELDRRQWTAYDMEERSGVPQPTTTRFLNGTQNDPRSATVRKWAAALNMTEAQLRGLAVDDQLSLVDKNQASNSNGANKPLSREELVHIVRKNKRLNFSVWSKLDIFLSPHDSKKKTEYIEMLIDTSVLKSTLSDKAFVIEIDTDDFNKHYQKGTRLVFNPIDDDLQPKPGQTLLVSLGDHKTLVKNRPLADRQFFEVLENGYPQNMEVSPGDYQLHGVGILQYMAIPLE
jgi:transcriptional regulator with XRE-family HTH domain